MNLYIRYFDEEALVDNIEDALHFLSVLPEIEMTPEMEKDLRNYYASDMMFPKRYKVKSRVYFIVIKTTAATMQDFKDKKAVRGQKKDSGQQKLTDERMGWYEGSLDFKRVVVNHLGKCEYRDTTFVVNCIADSPLDCYNRMVYHLEERVDKRSQFPSAKGKSFKYRYLGLPKPIEEEGNETAEEAENE